MKILGIVLAFLMLASTAFVGLGAANKSHKLAGQIAELTHQVDPDVLKAVGKQVDVPSTGRLNGGALVGALGGLAALALFISVFVKRTWVAGLGAFTVAAAALSAAIYPHVQTGPLDGAAPRSLALVAIALSIVGALGAKLATRRREPKFA